MTYDFEWTHTLIALVMFCVMGIAPIYSIVVSNPVSELAAGVSRSYQVECYPYHARLLLQDGTEHCATWTGIFSCWDVIRDINTGVCKTSVFVSVSSTMYTVAIVSNICAFGVIVLVTIGIGFLWMAALKPDDETSYRGSAFTFYFFASFPAAAFIASSLRAADDSTNSGTSNSNQTVDLMWGFWAVIVLPNLLLILAVTPSRD
jgi:hypothetical protein